jgi:hypothetical protein
MYNALFSPSVVLPKEPNAIFYQKIKDILHELEKVHEEKVELNMGDTFYKLDNISESHFYNDINQLQKKINQFLHDYQYVIMSKMDVLSKHYIKQTYLTQQKISNKQTIIWMNEAREFVLENREQVLPKLLTLYSFLDCMYHFSRSFSMKKLKKYQYSETEKPEMFIRNDSSLTCTLEGLLKDIWRYEIGIYNDAEDTRHWGLFKSSFYNIVLLHVLEKTMQEVSNAFSWESEEDE